VSALRQAAAAVRPARLATASVTAPPIAASRVGEALDAEMLVLKVTEPSGRAIALVWNYAIHGTALGPRNLRLSADLMGEASHRLEQELAAPVLFVNGAVGDVSPSRHGERAVVDLGAALAASARDGWRGAEPLAGGALAIGHRTIALPSPSLSAHNCLRGWLPRAIGLPLGSVFPRETTLTALVLGGLGVVTIPGELQTSLGRSIKAATMSMGLRGLVVAGVSNDYLGYFTTAAEYDRPGYVSCATLYGAGLGRCLADAAAGAVGALARARTALTDRAACDR
jgi:neutral ceramidase